MINKEMETIMQLVKGRFSPAEARELIHTLVNSRIQFYQIMKMRRWEGDHNTNTAGFDRKISELNAEREQLDKLIREADQAGLRVEIEGGLRLRILPPLSAAFGLDLHRN